mgnify:CR=1 FL=1
METGQRNEAMITSTRCFVDQVCHGSPQVSLLPL